MASYRDEAIGEMTRNADGVQWIGTVVLLPPGYAVSGAEITFPQPLTGVTLRYQTSAYANAGLAARKNYFTPYLYSVSFERL